MIGQCHRYSEYDTSPMNTAPRDDSRLDTSVSPRAPLWITRTAPAHGRRAGQPGNGTVLLNAPPATKIATRPAADANSRSRRLWNSGKAPSANRHPSNSSHARGGSRKNAADRSYLVNTNQHIKHNTSQTPKPPPH